MRFYACALFQVAISHVGYFEGVVAGTQVAEYIVARSIGHGGQVRPENLYDTSCDVFSIFFVDNMSAYVGVGRSVGCICACRDCRQYNGGNQSKCPVNHIGYLCKTNKTGAKLQNGPSMYNTRF